MSFLTDMNIHTSEAR